MTDHFGQSAYGIRMEWGPVGAARAKAAITVVVDVLSFSTSVCVAVERGMEVFPHPWRDERAESFAIERDAILAVGRREAASGDSGPTRPSLSPASLMTCVPTPRLVLPSPNGSSIAAAAEGTEVAAGCLRNAAAVAAWLSPQIESGQSVAIVAAGERWDSDDSLRPALEDQLGAGAILAALAATGHRLAMSPEAGAAADLFEVVRPALAERIYASVSGRELIAAEFEADVAIAAELSVSSAVPVLRNGAFTLA
ncbi:2-phosphosulfolactate phosphatase [Nocardioides sp.]|uniref:2-phosphosulfolactate phosphatase n=1 Tax=Nocardioides sp. TaxID=35761 RepID=UPI0026312D5F|nr:2-phosphosulfolactate phosphatase [Nocardioides sp.]